MSGIDVSAGENPSSDDLQQAVEKELSTFNEWFSRPQSSGGLGNEPLIPQELALLRTYLLARLLGKFSPQEETATTDDEDDIDALFG